MNNELDILAAKVLAGEASAEERARLDQLLANNAELRQEFGELQTAADAFRTLGPLARAMDVPPVPVPAECLRELQEAVRQKFCQPAAVHAKAEESSHLKAQAVGPTAPATPNI